MRGLGEGASAQRGWRSVRARLWGGPRDVDSGTLGRLRAWAAERGRGRSGA